MNDYYTAREAGKHGYMHIDPEPAVIYHFCVMHMAGTDETERNFAAALDRSDGWTRNQLAMEYVSEFLNTHSHPWGGFTVQHVTKYDHHRDDSYHYCFEAIVMPPAE